MSEGVRPQDTSAPHYFYVSLLRISTKPPLGHDRKLSTVNFFLQPFQAEGRFSGRRPYRRWRLSWNSSKKKSMPFKRWGTAVSHAPLCVSSSSCPRSWPPISAFCSASAADSSLSLDFLSLVLVFCTLNQ